MKEIAMNQMLLISAASVVGIISTARLTRLITQDTFPPAAWLRAKWQGWTHDGDWADLATCPFCLSLYLTAGNLVWAVLSDLHWTWWMVNGWLAAAYLTAMVVVRDGE